MSDRTYSYSFKYDVDPTISSDRISNLSDRTYSHSCKCYVDPTISSDRISNLSDRNVMLVLSVQVVDKTVLSVVLDTEAEQYLVEILLQEKTTSSELIKLLLQERWRSLQTQKTVLERMGGYPEQLLDGSENLSDRDVRRAIIDRHLQQRLEN